MLLEVGGCVSVPNHWGFRTVCRGLTAKAHNVTAEPRTQDDGSSLAGKHSITSSSGGRDQRRVFVPSLQEVMVCPQQTRNDPKPRDMPLNHSVPHFFCVNRNDNTNLLRNELRSLLSHKSQGLCQLAEPKNEQREKR